MVNEYVVFGHWSAGVSTGDNDMVHQAFLVISFHSAGRYRVFENVSCCKFFQASS